MTTQGTSSASGPADIRVSTVDKTLCINAFKISDNPLEVGCAWQEWLEDFAKEAAFEIKLKC